MTQTPHRQLEINKDLQKSNKLLFVIFLGITVIILLGIGLGIWYNQLPENNPQRNQSSCEKASGEWVAEQENCLISNRTTGEICTDGGQCQSGVCFPPDLTPEQQTSISDGNVITGITGTCYSEESIEGCIKQVLKGTISRESLCIE